MKTLLLIVVIVVLVACFVWTALKGFGNDDD